MIRYFIISLLITGLFVVPARAQYSISSEIHFPFSLSIDDLPEPNYVQLSAHYHTRLKRYRLEFLPGLHFYKSQRNESLDNAMGIDLPVSFYLLDFVNDCNCPTFSKSGTWFKKGWFVRAIPGWSRVPATGLAHANHLITGGITTGVDFGLSDLVTVSPYLGYKFHHFTSGEFTDFSDIHFGLQFHFRHDYGRK